MYFKAEAKAEGKALEKAGSKQAEDFLKDMFLLSSSCCNFSSVTRRKRHVNGAWTDCVLTYVQIA